MFEFMIALSAAAVQPTKPPLIPSFFTGGALYEICRKPNPGHCSMYVAGVLDGLFYADAERGSQRLCRAALNNVEAAALVTRRLEEDPEIRARAAAVAVEIALEERLPCPADPSAASTVAAPQPFAS